MRSEFYERALKKQGVTFEYKEKWSLEDVDARKSLANQARLDKPIDDDLVGQYGLAMKEGDDFPPLDGPNAWA